MKKRDMGRSLCFLIMALLLGIAAEGVNGEKKMATEAIKNRHSNRLAGEISPYLLQHAENPVDWYPWGDEAFTAAKKLDRPIFLSIGYSTCHWCHVMAHESFESERIARIMNEHFISIKVDREQRPDVDAVYMKAVQAMTGSGGWPLSVFLTPEGKPFYGGTYYPPTDSYGRPGFDKVLLAIADAWDNRRDDLLDSARKMTQYLTAEDIVADEQTLSHAMLENAAVYFTRTFDAKNGGFGMAPKFPQPSNLSMLLTHWRRTGNAHVLKMVRATLDAMAKGGIHDQLGGGFHRYSVDAVWLVPHFEKMLYDQALLTIAYLQAYQITGNEDYADIARDILDYVLRDMTDASGGFYSAEDADSEGKEGVFYAWTPKEINEVLPKRQADIFMDYYGVTEEGNFEERTSILSVKMDIEQLADKHKIDVPRARELLEGARRALFEARTKRIRPHRDEKIIAGWNGLMISSMAMAGRVLGEDKYTRAARRSAEFVLGNLRTAGRLNRFYGDGKAIGRGFADDYAFMTAGMIDLYEADYNTRWLGEAKLLADAMIKLFADDEQGGFFMTGSDSEELIVRTKPSYDGAIPNANSVAAMAMLKLGQITMQKKYTDQGVEVLEAFSGQLQGTGASLTEMLMAVDYQVGPRQEIVVAGDIAGDDTKRMLQLIGSKFLPRTVTMLHQEGEKGDAIRKIVPFIATQKMIGGAATAYVCENYVCNQPVTDIAKLKKMLASVEETTMEKDNAANTTVDK